MPVVQPFLELLIYALAAVLLTLAGIGVLRILRVPIDPSLAWFLAPAVAESIWAIALGLGVMERIRVQWLGIPVWIGTCAFAAYGYGWRRRSPRSLVDPLVFATMGLPVLVLLPYFGFGFADYPGSRLPDGWSYVAYGQYLWNYPRGTEGGLQPLYQWASHLVETRHVASAQLGLLSVLTDPGNVQSSTGLFLALSLYTFTSSCAALARARGWSSGPSLLMITMATLSGWTMNIVFANNYDNLAALAAFPAIAAITGLLQPRVVNHWVLLAIMLAGVVYTYPELAAIIGLASALMIAERWWRSPELRSWKSVVIAGALFLLCVAPYAPTAVRFFVNQAQFGLQTSQRPGESLFPGLLARTYQASAFWSLGGEFRDVQGHRLQALAAAGLFLLLARGLVRAVRAREIGLLAALTLPLLGAPLIVLTTAYSYGAYKMIAISWWAVVLVVVSGASQWNHASRKWSIWRSLALLTCLSIPIVATGRVVRQLMHRPAAGIDDFRDLVKAAFLTGGAPIGLFVDDWEASEWAVYFLRGSATRLGEVDGYLAMPHVQAPLARAATYPWQDVRYLLTDAIPHAPIAEGESWGLLWHNAKYRLWDVGSANWAVVTDVSVPNGIERLNGKPFFWLGGGPAGLRVTARESGCVQATATMTPGPGVQRTNLRRVTVTSSAGSNDTLTLAPGPNRLTWLVRPGVNEVRLTPVDQPEAPPQGPDRRPLIAGLTDVAITSISTPRTSARIDGVSNPNGIEKLEGQPFFWLGAGPATVRITSDSPGEAMLRAELVLGPSLAASTSTRRLRIRVPGDDASYETPVGGGAWTQPLALRPGETLVQLEATDTPLVLRQANGDRRPLVLGVQNLRLESSSRPESCR